LRTPSSAIDESVDALIDENTATSTCEYREIVYVRELAEAVEALDEADAFGEPPREQVVDLQSILAENLREQGAMRTRFTGALLLIFGLVIAFSLIASVTPYWTNAKDALLIVLPAVSGFVGFAVGFYYLTILGPPARGG
jgi:hypothetical protein